MPAREVEHRPPSRTDHHSVSASAETPRQPQHVLLGAAGPHALQQDQQVQISLLSQPSSLPEHNALRRHFSQADDAPEQKPLGKRTADGHVRR